MFTQIFLSKYLRKYLFAINKSRYIGLSFIIEEEPVHVYDIITYNIRMIPLPDYNNATYICAYYGYLDILKWLYSIHDKELKYSNLFVTAAERGHMSILKWLYTEFPHDSDCITEAVNDAAENGHLEVLEWLHTKFYDEFDCSLRAIDGAAKNGYLNIIIYLYNNVVDLEYSHNAFIEASWNGHLHVMQWLNDNIAPIDGEARHYESDAFENAAERGYLDLVDWLNTTFKGAYSSTMMDHAAKGGHLNILKWLHFKGATFSPVAFEYAAKENHLDALKWLYTIEPTGYHENVIVAAISNDNVDIVRWLCKEAHAKTSHKGWIAAARICNYAILDILWVYWGLPTLTTIDDMLAYTNKSDTNLHGWLKDKRRFKPFI